MANLRDDKQRLWDLVRFMRAELYDADLVTDEEYFELAQDHAAVARLEAWDASRRLAVDKPADKV